MNLTDQGIWSKEFYLDGTNTDGSALAVYDGQLVIGGGFSFAGSMEANRIVAWNGSTWSLLGTGINYPGVATLHQYGDELVAGGSFTEAGGIPATSIASWNGTRWRPLGSGVEGKVSELAVYDGSLIAAGDFQVAGGIGARSIARWDGTQWRPLVDDSTGVDGVAGPVKGLAVYRDELVVAGWFEEAGGVQCRGVARWNGASWQPLGTGVAPTSQAEGLCVYGDELIVGGIFRFAGGVPVNAIASWDGARWHALGDGVGGLLVTLVESFTVFRGDLIAGGAFLTAGDSLASSIARWDGSAWHPVGAGVGLPVLQQPAEVRTLAVYDDRLYAGGRFGAAGSRHANGIASWDGTSGRPWIRVSAFRRTSTAWWSRAPI